MPLILAISKGNRKIVLWIVNVEVKQHDLNL